MRPKSWQQQLKENGKTLQEYSQQLEKKVELLQRELVGISAGLHIPSQVNEEWDTATKLQVRAAHALKRASEMDCKKVWYLW
jgi:hypothetical protein